MNIKIAISSNINYYKNTSKLLLDSLLECGIEKNDIKMFINAAPEQKKENIDGIEYFYINDCCVELAPLLEIARSNLFADYWFLIHDTCKVGKDFKKLLYNIPDDKPDTLSVRSFPSMNIGSYKYEYILNNKHKLEILKETNFSTNKLVQWKNWGVANEDYLLWRNQPNTVVYNNIHDIKIYNNDNWYGTSTDRRTEYFSSLDLYKNKSNWGQSPNYKINL